MSTRTNNKAGTSAATPTMAVTPAGKEVLAPVASGNVPGPGETPASAAPSPADVVAAAKAFRRGFTALRDALVGHLQPAVPGVTTGRNGLSARRRAVIPVLSALLRDQPDLATGIQPAVIDDGLLAGDAMRLVAGDLHALFTEVADTARQQDRDAWSQAHEVLVVASHRARTERSMADKLAPVQATLKKGSRTDTVQASASAAVHTARKAQVRADRAQQRAATAARAATRVTQAHADRHPTPGMPVEPPNPQGPAPAVNPQGPAVNPQGPAPGR